jgi:hypothetical protein
MYVLSAAPSSAEVCMIPAMDALHHSGLGWFKLPPSFAMSATHQLLPATYDDILSHVDEDEHIKASDAEIHHSWITAIRNLSHFLLVDKTSRINGFFALSGMSLETSLDIKQDSCGYSQTIGLDYREIFSIVARKESFRPFLALVAGRRM